MAVSRFEVRTRQLVDDGRPFGDVGAYERLDGVLHLSVDPGEVANERIVDLGRAARDAQGRVTFEADVTLLQPVDAARGSGHLLADVVNRGGRTFMGYNLASAVASTPREIPSGDGFLMERGWTIAAVGWQWDVIRDNGLVGLVAPVALEDGQPIEGWVCVSQQVNARAADVLLADRIHQPYRAADVAQPDARLFVRDYADAPREEIDRARWRFARVEDGRMIDDPTRVALDGDFEAGRLYDVVYRTNTCPVVGAGLLAFRDATSFFRYATDEGNPARGRITHAFATGRSQSGRFLRTFIDLDLNVDEAERTVFDGFHVHIAGAREGEFNRRYGQPSGTLPYSAAFRPPFTYEDTEDPLTSTTIPGLLARARAHGRVPKVIATNTGTEYWRGDASMLHIDPTGKRDLDESPETRTYFLAGAQHGPGSPPLSDRSPVDPNARGAHAFNITHYGPVVRAALVNLERWVCDGVEPPPSALPRLADGTAVPRAAVIEVFRRLPTATAPDPDRLASLPRLDFGDDEAVASLLPPTASAPYPTLVSSVDTDGNEVAGVQIPDVAVPLATLAGWNPRHPDTGGPGQIMSLTGSTVPFPVTAQQRDAMDDPRPSIEERYRGREDFLHRVRAAASQLTTDRYLLPEDVEVSVTHAAARWDAIVEAGER